MKRLDLLDYARFTAAISVVLFHHTFNGIQNGKVTSVHYTALLSDIAKYGYLGVELFFMISGYVIYLSASRSGAVMFASNRALRLYPAYWAAVLLTALFAATWGGDRMAVTPTQVIANLTMLQSFFDVPHVDGVYWTLEYELKFYFAVFLLLALGFKNNLHTIFTYWPFFILTSFALGSESFAYLSGYYCYFSAGALFSTIKYGPPTKGRVRLIALLTIYLICIEFTATGAAHLSSKKGVEFSPAISSIVSSLFFFLFLYVNTDTGQKLHLPFSRRLGALTYPIYLIHAHIGYMLINEFATEDNKITTYPLIWLCIICLALIINKIIEEKLSPYWSTLFKKIFTLPITLANRIFAGTKKNGEA